MPPELRKWQCGRCGYTVDLPDHDTEYDRFVDAMNRIREHRWAHLVTSLESESDQEILGMCEDEYESPGSQDECLRYLGPLSKSGPSDQVATSRPSAEPVSQEDVDSCIEDVMGLLKADLPHARRQWYPISPDGGFNREEDT